MPLRQIALSPTDASAPGPVVAALRARFAAIRAELGIDAPYPAEAVAEAERVAAHPGGLPSRDLTDLPFWTLDPVGSMDLDQALHLEADGTGYRVRYAIADVPAFVAAGGALDAETRRRGQTVYCPDERVPLHPQVLSEGAASLLPGQVRPAYVWDLRLTGEGEVTAAGVDRAMVRSVDRLDYGSVQGAIDDGTSDERFLLLRAIGEARIAQERARGGASLPMPEQQVSEQPDGGFVLEFRPPRPSEDWNAQISLMTGMAAAEMMIGARVGILRTMPQPTEQAIARFRRQAQALGAPWPKEQRYGEFIRSLDRRNPRHLALIHDATTLFRGAGYTPLLGSVPQEHTHAAIAAPYAHVTAPLRRLVDRFGLVVCASVSAGDPIADWVRLTLTDLPEIMTLTGRTASAAERACADATEAAILSARVGERLAAVVVDHTEKGLIAQLLDLPVLAQVTGQRAGLGKTIEVRVAAADVASGTVTLTHGIH